MMHRVKISQLILALVGLSLGMTIGMTTPSAQAAMPPKEFFDRLSKDTLDLVDQFYDPQVEFHDPIGELKGAPAMRAYYAGMYKNVTSIRFEFQQELRQGDQYVAVWIMHLKADGLAGGQEIQVPGTSHLKYGPSGKVIYHRDYFDMGAMIYEHVPVLKSAIGWIKNKFKK